MAEDTRRRTRRVLLSLLAVLTVVCIPAVAAPPTDDWPGFLGPERDGRSTEGNLLRSWPEGGPEVLWHREAGEGYAAASVADGRLFLFEREGDTARLVALG